MHDIVNQARLNRRLTHDRPGRRFVDVDGSRWGELILPAPSEQRIRPNDGLKIVALTATKLGEATLRGLLSYEARNPGRIQLQAVSTDDAVETKAKIGLHKRIWRFYDPEARLAQTESLIETALGAGLPVYTGEMKIPWFRRHLQELAPDLIIVTGCGQILDADLIATPRLGVINFHPSDLTAGHGAGAQPYQDLVARNDPWTCWTLHRMVPEIDAGPIIGRSCPIYAADTAGVVTSEPDKLFQRMASVLPTLVDCLLDAMIGLDGQFDTIEFAAHVPTDLRQALTDPMA